MEMAQWKAVVHNFVRAGTIENELDVLRLIVHRQKELLAARGVEAQLHDKVLNELRIMLETQKESILEAKKAAVVE